MMYPSQEGSLILQNKGSKLTAEKNRKKVLHVRQAQLKEQNDDKLK